MNRVMPALVAGIHVVLSGARRQRKTWMAGTSQDKPGHDRRSLVSLGSCGILMSGPQRWDALKKSAANRIEGLEGAAPLDGSPEINIMTCVTGSWGKLKTRKADRARAPNATRLRLTRGGDR
jgi:hypothetical protein